MYDITKINDIVNSLIYDRAQADVDYALTLERESVHTDDDLKGAYNVSDRNRVGGAVNYIADLMRVIDIFAKADWNVNSIARVRDNANTIKCLNRLKTVLPVDFAAPVDLDKLSFQKANDVEHMLYKMYGMYMLVNSFFVGDGYASDFDAPDMQVFDDNWNFNF